MVIRKSRQSASTNTFRARHFCHRNLEWLWNVWHEANDAKAHDSHFYERNSQIRWFSWGDESATQPDISISSESILLLCFANTKINSSWKSQPSWTHRTKRTGVNEKTFSFRWLVSCWMVLAKWRNWSPFFSCVCHHVFRLTTWLHTRHLDNGFARVLCIKSITLNLPLFKRSMLRFSNAKWM